MLLLIVIPNVMPELEPIKSFVNEHVILFDKQYIKSLTYIY